jgi:hypothetical protein
MQCVSDARCAEWPIANVWLLSGGCASSLELQARGSENEASAIPRVAAAEHCIHGGRQVGERVDSLALEPRAFLRRAGAVPLLHPLVRDQIVVDAWLQDDARPQGGCQLRLQLATAALKPVEIAKALLSATPLADATARPSYLATHDLFQGLSSPTSSPKSMVRGLAAKNPQQTRARASHGTKHGQRLIHDA